MMEALRMGLQLREGIFYFSVEEIDNYYLVVMASGGWNKERICTKLEDVEKMFIKSLNQVFKESGTNAQISEEEIEEMDKQLKGKENKN